jgi:hypothetical protein
MSTRLICSTTRAASWSGAAAAAPPSRTAAAVPRGEPALLDGVADGLGPQRRDVEAQRVDAPAAPPGEADHHAALHPVRERRAVVVPERPVHLPPARRERQRPEHRHRPSR